MTDKQGFTYNLKRKRLYWQEIPNNTKENSQGRTKGKENMSTTDVIEFLKKEAPNKPLWVLPIKENSFRLLAKEIHKLPEKIEENKRAYERNERKFQNLEMYYAWKRYTEENRP